MLMSAWIQILLYNVLHTIQIVKTQLDLTTVSVGQALKEMARMVYANVCFTLFSR